ncbi:hypothetical protein HRG_014793 [Hirsutella rhossiliensis]
MKKAREAETGAAIPISELERWLAAPRIEFDESIAKSPDFLLKWWKEHKEDKIDQALIKAAMEYDILPFANSIIWRPDHIPGKLEDGMRESSSTSSSHRGSHRTPTPNLLHPKPISLRYQPPV